MLVRSRYIEKENLVYFELVRRGWHVTIGKIRSDEVNWRGTHRAGCAFYGAICGPAHRYGGLLSLPGGLDFGSRGAECRRSDASRIRHGETELLASPWRG